jgi:hypothetical protein
MAAKGYFSHVSPDGSTPWDWMAKVGYTYSYAGENLAVNFVDSDDVVSAWMASPEHRANILDANYTEMGYGIAQGEYQGKAATFVVQMFGAPPETIAAAVAVNTKPPVLKPTVQSPSGTASSVAASAQAEASSSQSEPVAAAASSSVLGASVASAPKEAAPTQASIFSQIATSPLTTADYIFTAIAAFFLVALLLKIFIKIKIQHPSLIFNGALMIFVINSLLLVNKYTIVSQLKIL